MPFTLHILGPRGPSFPKKKGPIRKCAVKPHQTVTRSLCRGTLWTFVCGDEPQIRQLWIFTALVSEKCASPLQKMFQGHMSSISTLARNVHLSKVYANVCVAWQKLVSNFKFVQIPFHRCSQHFSNVGPWNVQLSWHSSYTAWRSHIVSSILSHGNSNFFNNLWHNWPSASRRSNSQIAS